MSDAELNLTPATQVHHKEPASLRPDLFYVLENLESTCTGCHAKYSAEERRNGPS